MKKILLIGEYRTNNGPSNVTRSIVENSDSDMMYIKSDNRILKELEFIMKLLICNVVLICNGLSKTKILIMLLFRKRIVYLMHGCSRYENEINRQNMDTKEFLQELILEKSNLIVAVSEKYSNWVKNYYPQYKNKITFVNNGVAIERRALVRKNKGEIAVSGGNRHIKNNEIVCQAVEKLNEDGISCHVVIYGRTYKNGFDMSLYPHAKYAGQLEGNEYYAKLDFAELFVINSELESFGLVVADAINCNCSLLMSDRVGASSIMQTKQEDIIKNPHDMDEVYLKIKYLLEKNNADRLYKTIDVEECNGKTSYMKLKDRCLMIKKY